MIRTNGRRRSRSDASFLEELFHEAGRSLFRNVRETLQETAREAARRAAARAVIVLLAGALWITAAVFLLIGGVEALKDAGVPPHFAYLILGLTGALAGLWVWKRP